MSRTTIDFGIDLGTTNSAIALLKGVTPEIIKNKDQHDITPSCVHISKKGVLDVGFRAKQRIIQWPDDTFIEFKRLMGSDHVYDFETSGQKRKPEELSAEILKELRREVQKTGEIVEAAVITVPAAFKLHQCNATKKAAQLAGFKESPLLLEPTAAALAFGFQADTQKSYWLVYDFGGGTFDATIIKAEDGTIHVVNHGGHEFLGGSDIDKALVAKVIAPRIVKEFGLEDFDWANAGKGGRWREAFARLKHAAEQAKIELSQKEKASLDPYTVSNLKDERSGEVVIEELEMEITRAELVRVAEPDIMRSIEIAKRALKEAKLPSSAIEKLILVGGPTIAPYFREMLADALRIPLDYSRDPFTVVALGAAVFAGSQKTNISVKVPVQSGEYQLELAESFKHVGVDSAPMVGGTVSGSSAQDFTGFTLEIVNPKTQWRSGKIALGADGVFITHLHAEKGERNTFTVELYDPSGRMQKIKPDTFPYTVGGIVEQPLINSIGIMLANKEYARFFIKGSELPQRKTWPEPFHTVKPLKQGQSGEVIWIPIIEGENDLADRNQLIGRVPISAENIRRDLPAGSEVDITLKIDRTRIVSLEAYIPLLDEDLKFEFDLSNRPIPEMDVLKAGWDAELKRMLDLRAKAVAAQGDSARDILEKIEQSNILQEMKETLATIKGNPDAAAKFEKQLLDLQLKIDEAANSVEWPALVSDARDWLGYVQKKIADQLGNDQQRQKAEDLADEVEEIIRERKLDRLQKKIEQLKHLYFEIVMAQPGWWVNEFQQAEKERDKMTDQNRAARLLDQGRDCIAKNNFTGLQNIVRQLWELLPDEISKAPKPHHWDPGLVR